MKKILFLNNGYPTSFNPQYTTYVHTIANCLRKSGGDVDLLVIKYNRKITPLYKWCKYLVYWLRTLFVSLREYDMVYINHLPFVWTIMLNRGIRGKEVYVHWHGGELVSKTFFIRQTLAFIRPRACQYRHIVPSRYFKRKLMEILGVPDHLIAVSPSGGVDTKRFAPFKAVESDRFVIGFSGALTTDKGADVLLRLMRDKGDIERAIGRKVMFKVINYGREASFYVPLFREATDDIEIVEKMPKEQMPEFYNSLLLLLLSSVRIGESLGLVVLEAMSCDLPVVTFDICAFPEFVRSGLSGELAAYSSDIDKRVEEVKKAIVKIADTYSSYSPRTVIEKEYSEESVIEFYRKLNGK